MDAKVLSCLLRPQINAPSVLFKADPEEAATPQHVRNLGKKSERGSRALWDLSLAAPVTRPLSRPQDDDIDGEHIIAFAEESDPGKGTFS